MTGTRGAPRHTLISAAAMIRLGDNQRPRPARFRRSLAGSIGGRRSRGGLAWGCSAGSMPDSQCSTRTRVVAQARRHFRRPWLPASCRIAARRSCVLPGAPMGTTGTAGCDIWNAVGARPRGGGRGTFVGHWTRAVQRGRRVQVIGGLRARLRGRDCAGVRVVGARRPPAGSRRQRPRSGCPPSADRSERGLRGRCSADALRPPPPRRQGRAPAPTLPSMCSPARTAAGGCAWWRPSWTRG